MMRLEPTDIENVPALILINEHKSDGVDVVATDRLRAVLQDLCESFGSGKGLYSAWGADKIKEKIKERFGVLFK